MVGVYSLGSQNCSGLCVYDKESFVFTSMSAVQKHKYGQVFTDPKVIHDTISDRLHTAQLVLRCSKITHNCIYVLLNKIHHKVIISNM